MKFRTIEDIQDALNIIEQERITYGAPTRRFPFMFKRAICEAIDNSVCSLAQLSKRPFCIPGARDWYEGYQIGMYEMDNVVGVCKKKRAKGINDAIRAQLQQEITSIQDKLKLIEECEHYGLTVTVKVA